MLQQYPNIKNVFSFHLSKQYMLTLSSMCCLYVCLIYFLNFIFGHLQLSCLITFDSGFFSRPNKARRKGSALGSNSHYCYYLLIQCLATKSLSLPRTHSMMSTGKIYQEERLFKSDRSISEQMVPTMFQDWHFLCF